MPRRGADPDGKIALPITPMLDMTFQLLFFFIMNFNPADLEGQMEAALPATSQPGRFDPAPRPNEVRDDAPPEFPIDLTVEVRARPVEGGDGGISALSVLGADGHSVPIADLDALRKHLAGRRAASTRQEAVRIRADGRLSIDKLMKVIDACKAAGFTNTALVSAE